MIRSLDENVGKVLTKIEELNLSEETLIILLQIMEDKIHF